MRWRRCCRCAQPGPGEAAQPPAAGAQGGAGRARLTLECLLGESLPAASCLEVCLLPLLPAMADSRAWAGTCHRGSAKKQEKHQWLGRTQPGPEESGPEHGWRVPALCQPVSSPGERPIKVHLGCGNNPPQQGYLLCDRHHSKSLPEGRTLQSQTPTTDHHLQMRSSTLLYLLATGFSLL